MVFVRFYSHRNASCFDQVLTSILSSAKREESPTALWNVVPWLVCPICSGELKLQDPGELEFVGTRTVSGLVNFINMLPSETHYPPFHSPPFAGIFTVSLYRMGQPVVYLKFRTEKELVKHPILEAYLSKRNVEAEGCMHHYYTQGSRKRHGKGTQAITEPERIQAKELMFGITRVGIL